MNELLEHWEFFEPDSYVDILNIKDGLPKEWMQIFYVARCLFSEKSPFPLKGRLAPILERKEIFSKDRSHKEFDQSTSILKLNMGEALDIGRITSVHQISNILPREFITNPEDIFYKKLLNRELCRKDFNGQEGLSVSDLVYGREEELNRKQKVYILFDNSSSMDGENFNKLFAAKAICLEYLKKVEKENPQVYFRYFNHETGPLLKINKPRQIRDLIKYIINLCTLDCYETRIGDAILQAIQDIKSDPAFMQAEIIMITDGLGDVPSDIKERLGKIKFHLVLISGLDIDRYLKSYPDKESWEKANIILGSPDMPQFRDTYLKIMQVYRLQELTDIFVRIPSLLGERFIFSNPAELDLIRELKESLAEKLKGGLSNKEKYEIFQRLKFVAKYLQTMLTRQPSKELRQKINKEADDCQKMIKEILEDEWFSIDLENMIMRCKMGKDKRMLCLLKKSNTPRLIVLLFLGLIKGLKAGPKHLRYGFRIARNIIGARISGIYRNHRLKRRIKYINSRFSQVLNK